MVKQSYTDKITQKSMHSQKEKNEKNVSIYFKKREKEESNQINKQSYQW